MDAELPSSGVASFDGMVEEFQAATEAIREGLADLRKGSSSAGGGGGKEVMAEIDAQFGEARTLVKRLEVAHRQLESAEARSTYGPTLKLCQQELMQLKRDIVKAREAEGRSRLFEKDKRRVSRRRQAAERAQRDTLLHVTNVQRKTDKSLLDTRVRMDDSERSGEFVMVELRKQRDMLIHSRDNIEEANAILSKVRSVLNGMARRTVTNKIVTALVIVLLVAILILIIYIKFIKTGRWSLT